MKIFIDTSAWDAIEDSSDPNHEIALAFKDDLPNNCRLVTTDYVLDETYVTLTAVRPPARFGALEFEGNQIRHFKEKSTLH